MKANDNLPVERVTLPVPALSHSTSPDSKFEMDAYARFMRHLRHVANSRDEIKVLSAIQFVADMMDVQDAEIAKILVDQGLRAPRMALPATYLEFADNALMREDWEAGSASSSLKELRDHWNSIGEDRFAGFKRYYPSLAEDLFSRV